MAIISRPIELGALGRLTQKPTAVGSAVILAVLVLIALGAPVASMHDPQVTVLSDRLQPPSFARGEAGMHPFGTDHLGRDIWSRIVYGTRISLLVGTVTALGAGLIGITIGLLAGYYKGALAQFLLAVIDLQQTFPFFAFAIIMVATIGGGLVNVLIVLSITGWVPYARIVRGETLLLEQSAFVEAARATGCSSGRVMWTHILRNITSPILVVATFVFSQAIISEASLTFLGLGIPPSTPTWGGILSSSRDYIRVAWWMVVLPGLVLMLAVLAVNTLGDWLRDDLDPRSPARN